MKKVQYRKNRKGFTLAELLITVAITVILASFGFVSVSGYQSRLKLTEMDNTAREIFIAAQNHLTSSEASGSWKKVYQKNAAVSDFGVSVSAGDLGLTDSSEDYRAILSTRGTEPSDGDYAKAWNEILPYGSITESVRTEGQYIVIYNASSASVYGVLYTDNSSNAFGSVNSGFSFDLDDLSKYLELVQKSQNERISYTSGNGHVYIGWYGGAVKDSDDSSAADAPTVYFDNAEILKLNFRYTGNNYYHAVLKFTGKTSGAEVSVQVAKDGSVTQVSDSDKTIAERLNSSWNSVSGSSFSISLDDISRKHGSFGYLFDTATAATSASASSNANSSAKFIAGEDITVTAYAVLSDGTQTATSSATANSLFETVETVDTEEHIISISNGRHLQNLDASVSSILKSALSSKKNKAELTRNITWNSGTDGFFSQVSALENSNSVPTEIYGRDGNIKANNSSFCSIMNDLLLELDGNNHTLANFSFTGNGNENNAGLFAQNPNTGAEFKIHDLIISNSSASSSSGNAGILMGHSTYSLTFTEVHVTAADRNSVTVSAPQGSAGGLIGRSDAGRDSNGNLSTTLTVSNVSIGGAQYSLSALTVNGGSNAGGLIGQLNSGKKADISDVDITVSDAATVISDNGSAGGLIGSVTSEGHSEVTITDCNYISSTQKDSITSSDQVTGKSAAGGFIGSISEGNNGKINSTISNSFSNTYVALNGSSDGASAGGFIGSNNCSDGSLRIYRAYAAGRTASIEYQDSKSGQGRYNVYSSKDGNYVGGFIGSSSGPLTIQASFTAASVYGNGDHSYSGGFIASAAGEVDLTGCYAAGRIFGTDQIGAFIGNNQSDISVKNCYALKGSRFNDSISLIGVNSSNSDVGDGIVFAESGTKESPFAVDDTSKGAATTNDSSLGTQYPFMTTLQLSSAYLSDSSDSTNSRDNQVFGDWEVPAGSKVLIVGVNGNKLTVHFALPKGTTQFTIGVRGDDSDTVLYVPVYVVTDNTGNKKIYWENFHDTKYGSDNEWTTKGIPASWAFSENRANDKDEYSQLYSEGQEVFKSAVSKSGNSVNTDSGSNLDYYAIDLDDLTVTAHRFSSMFADTGLKAGENISVAVVAGWDKSFAINSTTGVTVNSLFDNGTDHEKGIALIANSRHLENLDTRVAGVTALKSADYFSKFTIAEQVDNIHWSSDDNCQNDSIRGTEAFVEELGNSDGSVTINTTYSGRLSWNSSFFPIVNNYLRTYRSTAGNKYSIENVTINLDNVNSGCSSSAIFEELGGSSNNTSNRITVQDISLHNITSDSSRNECAALVANAYQATFSNISLDTITSVSRGSAAAGGLAANVTNGSFSKINLNDITVTSAQSGAGGLAANVTNGVSLSNVTLTGKSLISCTSQGSSGGLIASVSGSFVMSNCVAYGKDISVKANHWNMSVGGLVGAINAGNNQVQISDSQAAVLISADNTGSVNGGGLIGSILGGQSGSSIERSQSGGHTVNGQYSTTVYNLTLPGQDSCGGGLIGTISNSNLSISNCYSTMSVSAKEYAGGFVGRITSGSQVSINQCYSTGLVNATGNGWGEYYSGAFVGYIEEGNVSGKENYYLEGINSSDINSIGNRYTGDFSVYSEAEGAYPFTHSQYPSTSKYDFQLSSSYPYQAYTTTHVGDWPESRGIIIENGYVLSAKIRYTVFKNQPYNYDIQIGIYGESSEKTSFLMIATDKSGKFINYSYDDGKNLENAYTYDANNGLLTLTLDDISSAAGKNRFSKLFPSFIPGENVSIFVDYSADPSFMDNVSHQTNLSSYFYAKTNSLFGDGSFESKYTSSEYSSSDASLAKNYGLEGNDYSNTALILNARHLENLSEDVSLYTKAGSRSIRPQNAKQVTDIDVAAYFDNVSGSTVYFDDVSGSKQTQDNCLIGIINDDLDSYDGGGHQISNLKIGNTLRWNNTSSTSYPEIGLFARISNSNNGRKFSIQDLSLVNPDINGESSSGENIYSGALIGRVYSGNTVTISNVSVVSDDDVTSGVSGSNAGGFIGGSEGSTVTIEDSYVSGKSLSISGQNNAGGMIGTSSGDTVTITDSYVSEDSLSNSDQSNAGGLVGSSASCSLTVTDSNVSGGNLTITGQSSAGGLISTAAESTIEINRSHVSGKNLSITGVKIAGGLIGFASASSDQSNFKISNSFATVYVSASDTASAAGGLIGSLSWYPNTAEISNSYAGGHTSEGSYLSDTDSSVSGRANVYSTGFAGGLIGSQGGKVQITNSFSAASVLGNYSAGMIASSSSVYDNYSVSISDSYYVGQVFRSSSDNGVSSEIINLSGVTLDQCNFDGVTYLNQGDSVAAMNLDGTASTVERISSVTSTDLKALVSQDNSIGSEKTSSYDLSLCENDQSKSYPYPIYTTISTTDADGNTTTKRKYIGDWIENDVSTAKVFFFFENPNDLLIEEKTTSSSPDASASAESIVTPEASATPSPSVTPESSPDASGAPSPSVTPESSAEASVIPSVSPSAESTVTPETSASPSASPSAVPSENSQTSSAEPTPSASAGGEAVPYLHALKLPHPLLKEEETETGTEDSSDTQTIEGVTTEEGDVVTENDQGFAIERTVDIGTTVSLSLIHPVQDGYTLVGWRLVDSETDHENTGSESLEVMDGSGNAGIVHYDYDPDAVITVEGDTKLEAVWVKNDLLSFANTWTSSVSAAFNPYPGNTNNCTWTAWQLVYETLGIRLPAWGDAGYWLIRAKEAGFTVSSEPAVNSIVVFSNHVGFVSDVSEDGQYVYIKEGNYSGMYHEGWWPAYGDRHGQKRYGYIWLSGEGTSDISEEEIAEMENEQAVREQAEAEQKEAEETIVIADGYYVGNNEEAFLQDLASNGLSVGTRSEAYSNTAPAGTILSHDSGTFEKGAAVNYTVSLGQQVVSEETAGPSESPISSAESTPSASVSVITAVPSASSIPSVSPEASPSAPVPSVSEITPEASVVPSVIPEASSSASASSIPEVTTEPSAPVPSVTEIVPEASVFPSMIPEASAVSTAVPSVSAEASVVPSASAGSNK